MASYLWHYCREAIVSLWYYCRGQEFWGAIISWYTGITSKQLKSKITFCFLWKKNLYSKYIKTYLTNLICSSDVHYPREINYASSWNINKEKWAIVHDHIYINIPVLILRAYQYMISIFFLRLCNVPYRPYVIMNINTWCDMRMGSFVAVFTTRRV